MQATLTNSRKLSKEEQYRLEPIREEKVTKGDSFITVIYDYDKNPEAYKAARKRQQNKKSAQVSRVAKNEETLMREQEDEHNKKLISELKQKNVDEDSLIESLESKLREACENEFDLTLDSSEADSPSTMDLSASKQSKLKQARSQKLADKLASREKNVSIDATRSSADLTYNLSSSDNEGSSTKKDSEKTTSDSKLTKEDQYRVEPIREEKFVKGEKVVTVYEFDVNPEAYKAARKRQQNKKSAQVSRLAKTEEQMQRQEQEESNKQLIKRLQKQLEKKATRIQELKSKLASMDQIQSTSEKFEDSQPGELSPCLKRRKLSAATEARVKGDDDFGQTLDEEISIKLPARSVFSSSSPKLFPSAPFDRLVKHGAFGATIYTSTLELLDHMVIYATMPELEDDIFFQPNKNFGVQNAVEKPESDQSGIADFFTSGAQRLFTTIFVPILSMYRELGPLLSFIAAFLLFVVISYSCCFILQQASFNHRLSSPQSSPRLQKRKSQTKPKTSSRKRVEA